MKYGAKNCAFCHAEPSGGEGWNDRGRWLIREKQDRNLNAIQVDWLEHNKPVPKTAAPKKPSSAKS